MANHHATSVLSASMAAKYLAWPANRNGNDPNLQVFIESLCGWRNERNIENIG